MIIYTLWNKFYSSQCMTWTMKAVHRLQMNVLKTFLSPSLCRQLIDVVLCAMMNCWQPQLLKKCNKLDPSLNDNFSFIFLYFFLLGPLWVPSYPPFISFFLSLFHSFFLSILLSLSCFHTAVAKIRSIVSASCRITKQKLTLTITPMLIRFILACLFPFGTALRIWTAIVASDHDKIL